MSGITGAKEVVADLQQLADDLGDLGDTVATVATDRAKRLAPTLAQLQPTINASGAVLNYSGVLYPPGFEDHITRDLEPAAVAAVEAEIDATTKRAGLT